MQQYRSVHEKLPKDTVLFFRLGDFYEMFFEDAENCSRILGMTLTQRNGFPMAGIPYHTSETYIDKLLKAGRKVAVCDQMEEPRPGKLIERSLTRTLTPGTVLEEAPLFRPRMTVVRYPLFDLSFTFLLTKLYPSALVP